ncbi:proline dehydrogenase [Entomortierella parvispora]|uniref:proline dehydrogenase n=1 Tax=Entomortierella parvispora TaxID=205924 RepID=A0A9P3H6B3_9FUNG|nr:proline dehydrogenase [Entomortierella parvispora]
MTTRVLASSFHRLPLSPPASSLAQRSVARLATGQSLSRPLFQLSHASTPLPVTRPPRSAFSTTASSFASRKNVLGNPSEAGPVAAAASLPTSSSSLWTRAAIGGTIALVTSAAVLNQLSKAPQLEAIGGSNSFGSSSLTGDIMVDLQDEHNKIGVEKKSNADLMLSMLVYKLCTLSLLVDMAPRLISIAEMLHLTPPVYWFVRKTFFAQFCGGESADDCIDTMSALKSAGINSILDLSVEADLDESELKGQSPDHIRARFNQSADYIAEQISTCIQTASNMSKSFAAIKITAMGSPLLLQQVSSTLNGLESSFKKTDEDKDGKITKDEFKQLVKMLPNPMLSKDQSSLDGLVDALFQEADRDQDGMVDWVDFASTISMNRDETRALFVSAQEPKPNVSIPGLVKEDLDDYKRLLERMESLCEQAEKTHTRLMIDAEQTYFQPAIDSVALHLQERFNHSATSTESLVSDGGDKDGPLIFNTYQMYLKDALGRLQQDYTRAQRNGYVLAAKLVRGAYMVSERKRAQELGLEDPICDGIEATHVSYNAGVDFLLGEMMNSRAKTGLKQIEDGTLPSPSSPSLSLKSSPVVLFVASHNKDSVIRTCERMQELELSPESGLVMFGQLMGMCDQISYTLGQHGYGIYKYVPYGPIHHVIPYLIRRAQENASVLGGVAVERRLLWEELKSRFVAQTGRAQIQDFKVSAEDKVQIQSYINNLHPVEYADAYPILEEVFERFIPLFEEVLGDLQCIWSKRPRLTLKKNWESPGWIPNELFDEHGYLDIDDKWWESQAASPIDIPDFVAPPASTPYDLKNKGRPLQVIVKLANIELTPMNPAYKGGAWHVEGMANEEIVATGIYYYHSENVTESRLNFRIQVWEPDHHEHNQYGSGALYGLSSPDALTQHLDGIVTKQDRCIVFPNIYQHQVQPFELVDKTRSGKRQILVFFLVDPQHPILSTTHVPPQQLSWAIAAGLLDEVNRRLPPELVALVSAYLDWPMTLKEAKQHREVLMAERKHYGAKANKEVYGRPFSLCEH